MFISVAHIYTIQFLFIGGLTCPWIKKNTHINQF